MAVTTAIPTRPGIDPLGIVSSVNTPATGKWVKASALKKGEHLRTPEGKSATADGGHTPASHQGWMWDLTIQDDHDFYVIPAVITRTAGLHADYAVAGNTPILVHNCNIVPESVMKHVLHGDINEDGDFGGWHMHPGNDPGAYPEGRFINGEMVTNADGSVTVRGTVGAYDPNGYDMTSKSSIGHTFFPEGWGEAEIRAAGEDLFQNGAYSHGGSRVTGTYGGVNMLGLLAKNADGEYVPSTFFPQGG